MTEINDVFETLEIKDIEKPELLDESDFANEMKHTAEPYIAQFAVTGRISPEVDLYYELYSQKPNKGTIVICHGYTEYSEKFHELIYYFLKNGYQAAVYDQRGHGRSMREYKDRQVVHIADFETYVSDLHHFVHEIVIPKMEPEKGRLFVFGHSMGGAVAARYIETYPDDFDRAVLSAPMMGIRFDDYTEEEALDYLTEQFEAGKAEERVPFMPLFNPNQTFESSLASSKARFEYYQGIRCANPEYQTGSATCSWAYEAVKVGKKLLEDEEIAKIRIPVIIFAAQGETKVSEESQAEFVIKAAKTAPGIRGVIVPDTRHEIYRANNPVLRNYLAAMFDFLD